MEISGASAIFLFGCAGGALLELLRWWKLRESPEWPIYARKVAYWLVTFAMIVAGGLVAIAYGTGQTTAILAMNLGASTPAIIGALAAQPPKADGAAEAGFGGPAQVRGRLRNFLAFGR